MEEAYGVKNPFTVAQAYHLDKLNRNSLWKYAIDKETPESLFIRSPKQITNITYNIGNNSFYLSTPIQRTHNPISNKISELTVNCNFEINIPDTKIYIYQITIVFKNQTSLPRHIIDHRNSVPNIIKETNHRITY